MRYPPPAYAATVWLNGETLNVAFEGTGPNGQGHSIALPDDERGVRQLLAILRERRRALTTRDLTIGKPSAPVQYDIDEIIRRLDRKPSSSSLARPVQNNRPAISPLALAKLKRVDATG